MANIIKRVWNQNRMVQIEDLKGMTFQAEQAGHTFQISGIDDDGNTVALTGTPAGVLLRPDNTDVALTCSVSGGVVSATLPANCYDVPGRFGLTIFITSGSSKTAIYAAVGTVTRTSSGTVAPGTSQSVVDLINAINTAINSIPASYSALLADIAPTYSNSALYSVGQYAWYDGDLKRCIVPITTAESYTAAHWTSAVLGQDVSDLKSAFENATNTKKIDFNYRAGYIKTSYNTGETVTISPTANAAFSYAVIDCQENDLITLNAYGWTTGRLWAFVDSQNKLISKSNGSVEAQNLVIKAPAGTAKCILNSYYEYVGACYIGRSVDVRVNNVQQLAEKANNDIYKTNLRMCEDYTILINGIIDSQTGKLKYDTDWVSTEYIQKKALFEMYKPTGIRVHISYYRKDFSFISKSTWSENASGKFTVDDITVQDTEYIIFSFSIYEQGESTATTPADIIASDAYIKTYVFFENNGIFNFRETELEHDIRLDIPYGDQRYKNMIVSYYAMYVGNLPPTIEIVRNWKNSSGSMREYYGSGVFIIGGKNAYKRNSFRVAPWMEKQQEQFTLKITIPENTKLYIRELHNEYDDTINREGLLFNINAHGYAGAGVPDNSQLEFDMAAKLGYKYCITIPKVTEDGIYVCFHDDANIQNSARNNDGTEIADEYKNRPISDFTYAELLQFDIGIKRGIPFAGERIPLLSDFFKTCARTGMHPMLSVHPSLEGHWGNIKDMAKKYGVLSTLNIKSRKAHLAVPMAVLGDEIESYTLDVNADEDQATWFSGVLEQYGITKARKIIEYFYDYITDERIDSAISAGFQVGCASYGYHLDRVRTLIEKGVTEFTEDYNASAGLNWL